ncbi:MAG: amidohydrolase [Candidatus Aminicenantes bacterium]|nr:amidohydrolase [Candidatus Aminicenantes bacterium]
MKKHLAAGLLIVLALAAAVRLPGAAADEKIRALAKQIEPELIAMRRDLHAHPELGLQEKRTSALVAAYLRKLGFEVKTGFAVTGVLGILKGGKPGPVVAMRGDMDGLPISEETGLSFASKARAVLDGRECGLMHACGHDIHTTVLLGVARVLAALKDELAGTVLFVAQPAEEYGDGARRMIEDGVFKDLKPEACFAFHVDDSLKVGKVGYTSGFSSANVDGFTLVIRSEGCHGANPWLCVDPIVVGASIVLDLQIMLAREIDVSRNAVITVGKFHAGTAENVIPQTAELAATVRNYGEDQRQLLKEKVGRLVAGACAEAGAAYDLDYQFGIPSRYNDPKLLAEILPTAARVLGGPEALVEQLPEMGGEDFAYFTQVAPSVMLNLGVVPANLEKTAVHSPTFMADEAGIALGVELMADIIMDYLGRRQGE